MIEGVLFSLAGVKPLVVLRRHRDSVEVPLTFRHIYGAKVVSNIERIKVPPESAVKKFLAVQGKGKVLYMVILKDMEKRTGFYTHEVYYFSFSRDLINLLPNIFGGENVRLMTGLELLNALYSCMYARSGVEIDEFRGVPIKRGQFFSEQDGEFVLEKSKRLTKEIDPDDYRVFIGVAYEGQPFDLDSVFYLPWRGVLWIGLELGSVESMLKEKEHKATYEGGVFRTALAEFRQGVGEYGGIRAVLITRERERAEDFAVPLFQALGFSAVEVKNLLSVYVKGTPLSVRDWDFTYVVPGSVLTKYMVYSYEKTTVPEEVEVWGKNRNGSYVAFNVFTENPAPHVGIFAPTGAGKSFSLQNMISQILRADIKKLYMGESVRLRDDVRIRYFDKGFSAELFFRLLRERGADVGLFSARLDEITFNAVEVEEDSEEEYEFAINSVNVCLKELSLDVLDGYEQAWLERALRTLRRLGRGGSYMANSSVVALKKYPALEGVYERLRKKGYSDRDRLGDLKEEEFEFLFRPTLVDVLRFLNTKVSDVSLTKEEKHAVERLKTKVEALAQHDTLALPTQVNLAMHRLIYLDYEFLSSSKYFVPIMLGIMKKLIKQDKYKKGEHEKVYYVMDEAHNLFANEYFYSALRVLVKEARKWRISLWLSTQNFEDIPQVVIRNLPTKMLISPQEESERQGYLRSFAKYLEMDIEGSDLEHVYYSQPPRTFTVWYSSGVFSLSIPVDEVKKKVFDSYARQITTEDGVVIRKGVFGGA